MLINRRSIAQKVKLRISGGISREIRGLDIKERTLSVKILIGGRTGLEYLKRAGAL
jgi:hypothetical protein